VGVPLKAALDKTVKRSPIILSKGNGKRWSADGFRSSWRRHVPRPALSASPFTICEGLPLPLGTSECTQTEIATLNGHSLRDVAAILDAHYLNRDPALATSAITKLERKFPTERPTVPESSDLTGRKA
jgi:hypothetical protein